MRVVQVGNFGPTYSTENELLHAMGQHGFDVTTFQEGDLDTYRELVTHILHERPDFVLWTSTKSLRDVWGQARCWQLLAEARKAGVPVVGYHLDRWWGLKRQDSLDDAYFQCDLMVTADGGHDEMWATKNINHRWLPPAISERWCRPGMFRDEYACDVMFVGSWRDYGHREWRHRGELIATLSQWYGDRFMALPRPGKEAVRGLELNDAYWSAKVVVGDSCLVPKVDGSPMTHYCSDRIPETLGRGGALLHPRVEGIFGITPETFQYAWWTLGDWRSLRSELENVLSLDDDEALNYRLSSIERIKANHTYTVRIGQLMEIVDKEVR